MFLRYPKWFRGGSVITDEMALNIDFAPTILDAVGVKNKYNMDGVSLHDLYTGAVQRDVIFVEDLPASSTNPDINSVRTQQYVYNWYSCTSSTEEFFDLTTDPLEDYNQINNVAYSSLIDEYRVKKDSLKTVFNYTLNPDVKTCNLVTQQPAPKQSLSSQWHAHAFPNPADQQIYLTIPVTDESVDAAIINAHGETILHRKILAATTPQTIAWDVSLFPNGVYYILLKNKNRNEREKIVIAH